MSRFEKFDKWLGTNKGARVRFIVLLTICTLGLLYHLVGCGDDKRSEKYEDDWSKAKPLVMERYIDPSSYYERKLSTFIMDDHKIIIYHGSYGGRMVAIPLDNDEEYIRMLEEENQLLGETLAEYSLNYE